MQLKEEVELLRRVPLFANVAPAKLKLLAFTSDRVSYQKDQILFRQGDAGDAAFVVLVGAVDILGGTNGNEIRIATLGANSIVGEIAILCDVTRTATVKASEPLEVLRISKDHFLKLLAEFPEMALEIMRVLAQRLSDTTAELTEARNKLRRQAQ
jgi:CRP-like cAMP-binding protein